MLTSLSCRAHGQNGVVFLGWIYLGNLFWVCHHLYYRFALEQLTILSHYHPIYINWIYLPRLLANSAINKSAHILGACKVALQQGLHLGMTLFHMYFFLHSSHFCHHIQFPKPTVILQLNLWKLDQSHSIL